MYLLTRKMANFENILRYENTFQVPRMNARWLLILKMNTKSLSCLWTVEFSIQPTRVQLYLRLLTGFIQTGRLPIKSEQNIPFAYCISGLICELPLRPKPPRQRKNYWGLIWTAETGLSTSTTPTYLPLFAVKYLLNRYRHNCRLNVSTSLRWIVSHISREQQKC